MPILSLNFGLSEISLLFLDDLGKVLKYNYPYSNFDNPQFTGELLKQVAKETRKSLKNADVIACGFPSVYTDGLSPKLSLTLDSLSGGIEGYHPVFVSNFTVLTSEAFLSTTMMNYLDDTLSSFFPNLSLYPFLVPDDSLEQFALDNFIRFFPSALLSKLNRYPLLFSGDRFSKNFRDDPVSYILMLDLIKEPGVYELQIDTENVLANLAMLSRYDGKLSKYLGEYQFKKVGTLINSVGPVECLLESEDGSTQFIEVKNEELILIPMLENSQCRAVIKNPKTGNIERKVSGGTLGLIVDTRPKNEPGRFNKEFVQENMKTWMNSVREVMTSL